MPSKHQRVLSKKSSRSKASRKYRRQNRELLGGKCPKNKKCPKGKKRRQDQNIKFSLGRKKYKILCASRSNFGENINIPMENYDEDK